MVITTPRTQTRYADIATFLPPNPPFLAPPAENRTQSFHRANSVNQLSPHYRCSTACFPSASRTGRGLPRQKPFHPISCQSIEVPFGKPACANPFIDLLGFRVPIQTGPFHPSATAIVGQLDAMPQQRRADPPPPPFRKDEQ